MQLKSIALTTLSSLLISSVLISSARADVKLDYETQFLIPSENKEEKSNPGKITVYCKGNKIRLESGPHVTISDLDTGITLFFDTEGTDYRKFAPAKPGDKSPKAPLFPMTLEVTGSLRPGADTVKVGKYPTQRFSGLLDLQFRNKKDAPALPMKLSLNFKSCQSLAIGPKFKDTGMLGILKHLTDGMMPPMGTMLGGLLWQNPEIQKELGRSKGIPLTLRLELTPDKGTPQLLPANKTLIYELQAGAISEAALPDSLFTVPAGRTPV
jgi:hypothetical protein